MPPRRCDNCTKVYAHRQSLFKHKKKCIGGVGTKALANLSVAKVVKPQKMMDLSEPMKLSHKHGRFTSLHDGTEALQDARDPTMDNIPTFDGAEFCDKKPKSDETLIKIKKMLKIPHHSHASIVKEERQRDNQDPPEKSNGSHHNYSDKVEKDIDSSEGESMDESGSDESGVDMEENGESDEVDGRDMEKLEDEEEAPLDDAAIRNLIKRFKILHHQLIHEGRKDHVPNLLEIITILNDEGQLGDEYDRIVKSVTKYQ